MSRKAYKDNLSAIISYAEGEIIQYSYLGSEWVTSDTNAIPQFGNTDYRYRIKPKLPKYRVSLMNDETTRVADNTTEAESYSSSKYFVKWLTDWIEYDPAN